MVLFFLEIFNDTFMGFSLFIVVDAYEEKVAAVVMKRIEVASFSYLVYCAVCTAVSLKFYNHGRDACCERNEL